MDEKLLKSKSWVANYFYSKIREYQYHLEQVVKYCDESKFNFENRLPSVKHEGRLLTYAYGSLANAVQTLKDGGSFFLPEKITWGDIKALPHGDFFYLSRNASTHDGNPIINTWIDGKYYVGDDIERFDSCGKFIVIKRPSEDVRKLTLEFSLGFYGFLYSRLKMLDASHELTVPLFGADRIESIMSLPTIPKEARDAYIANRAEILAGAPDIKADSIANALEELQDGIDYIKRISC